MANTVWGLYKHN